MARRILDSGFTDNDKFVSEAYRLALGRRPDSDELTICSDFLQNQSARAAAGTGQSMSFEDRRQEVLTDFCHALLNSNEFVYVD